MATATFLSNEALWQTLSARMKSAKHVDAAIAYFGQNGANLFPLQRGHRLIVDMSISAVKAGSTDPREIEKLDRHGVEIFTRRNLHAKIVIADNTLIVGSANVSKQSQDLLDEAAILTTDPVAVRRARDFIDRLCTEPVLPEYLEQCKQLYRPPRFYKGKRAGIPASSRVRHAKLWIVNLREGDIPESEIERYERGEEEAQKLMKDSTRSELISFHWPHKPKMADELEAGDWIIQVMTYKDKSVLVYPPAQFLFVDHYVREMKSGKLRYVFHLESPKGGQALPWADFCHSAKSVLSPQKLDKPRTRPIRDVQTADDLLRLWTPRGRISKR
jgi:hypothetical protein